MGRARPRAAVAVAAVALLGGFALAQPAEPPLKAMRWAAPGADPRRAFATTPPECLKLPEDPVLARRVEVGRAAFRTPLVLGGQAARAGLSCESCHRAGRGNPDFLFPGVSGPAGTADVTSSLFSTHRGNGAFDPKPIPDLGGPKAALKVKPQDLRSFVHGLVVEEFDGPEPAPAVLDGLVAYVQALGPGHCPAAAEQPVTLALLMAEVRRAVAAAEAELAAGDPRTAVLMVAAARAQLGHADERYAALPAAVRRIRAADAALAGAQQGIREGRPGVRRDLVDWLRDSRSLEAELRRREAASLFDPGRLREAAKRRLPAEAS